jgi:cytochrome P450
MDAVATRPRMRALDLASATDPYPTYAELRGAGPVSRGELGQWLVTGHREAAALLRDPRLGSAFPREFVRRTLGAGPAASFPERIVLTRDPPDHTRLRRFLGRAFGTPAIRSLRASVESLVDELLTPAHEAGRFDVVADLAVPLPVTVVCRLIGIPDSDRAEVLPQVIALAKVFDAVNLDPERIGDIDTAVRWLRSYVGDLLTAPAPGSLAALYDGAQDADEFIDNLLFLFHAGFETTMGLISNGCAALMSQPSQWERLRTDPTLLSTAIEEFLRYDSPIQNTIRVAHEPIECAGVKIRAGRSVMLLLGAANRDPAVFRDPDRLDVGRDPNPHLGFGGGLHHCLGMALARLMGDLVFERLVGLFAVMEPAGAGVRRHHGSLRSYERLPVAVRTERDHR